MKIQIVETGDGDKELYLNDEFQASWNESVNDMEVIIPYALDCAVSIGAQRKQREIKKALDIK